MHPTAQETHDFSQHAREGENTKPFTEATSSTTVAMIDIHTHILPGFDDGATSLAESIEMVNLAETDGIGAIFATPHSAFSSGKTTARQRSRRRSATCTRKQKATQPGEGAARD